MNDPVQDSQGTRNTPATGPDIESTGAGPGRHQPGAGHDGLLAVAANLSRYHREHEKYYSEAPLADAIALQRTARTLIALAEQWTSVEPAAEPGPSPFAGAPDLNDDRAIETSGVLFMEGEGEPAEIRRIKSELETIAASSEQSGSWLAAAMEASWAMADALLAYPQLADLLAERHRIIGNNWQNACTAQLVARYLRRAVAVMTRVDFSPAALRRDLAGPRSTPGYLFAAAELINHAADLAAASSVLTHENERRWRTFHARVEQITASALYPLTRTQGTAIVRPRLSAVIVPAFIPRTIGASSAARRSPASGCVRAACQPHLRALAQQLARLPGHRSRRARLTDCVSDMA